MLQLEDIFSGRHQELKASHQQQLDRLKQEQDVALRRMQLEMQDKVCFHFAFLKCFDNLVFVIFMIMYIGMGKEVVMCGTGSISLKLKQK